MRENKSIRPALNRRAVLKSGASVGALASGFGSVHARSDARKTPPKLVTVAVEHDVEAGSLGDDAFAHVDMNPPILTRNGGDEAVVSEASAGQVDEVLSNSTGIVQGVGVHPLPSSRFSVDTEGLLFTEHTSTFRPTKGVTVRGTYEPPTISVLDRPDGVSVTVDGETLEVADGDVRSLRPKPRDATVYDPTVESNPEIRTQPLVSIRSYGPVELVRRSR